MRSPCSFVGDLPIWWDLEHWKIKIFGIFTSSRPSIITVIDLHRRRLEKTATSGSHWYSRWSRSFVHLVVFMPLLSCETFWLVLKVASVHVPGRRLFSHVQKATHFGSRIGISVMPSAVMIAFYPFLVATPLSEAPKCCWMLFVIKMSWKCMFSLFHCYELWVCARL